MHSDLTTALQIYLKKNLFFSYYACNSDKISTNIGHFWKVRDISYVNCTKLGFNSSYQRICRRKEYYVGKKKLFGIFH